jgi:hypothetical protein
MSVAFLAPQRQKNKRIYDWHELEQMVDSEARLKKSTAISDHMLGMVPGHHAAQLSERAVAVGRAEHIELMYMHTPPGRTIEESRIQKRVYVYPAAGGRTTYQVHMCVSGRFANRHLPFNASDLRERYDNFKFAHGAGGMYQPGEGPRISCGVSSMLASPRSVLPALANAGPHVESRWLDVTRRFFEQFDNWCGMFPDTRVTAELNGLDEPDSSMIQLLPHAGMRWYNTALRVSYFAKVRLVLPNPTRDVIVYVLPQSPDLCFGPHAVFCVQASDHWGDVYKHLPGALHSGIVFTMTAVMSALRDIAASCIYIPA